MVVRMGSAKRKSSNEFERNVMDKNLNQLLYNVYRSFFERAVFTWRFKQAF